MSSFSWPILFNKLLNLGVLVTTCIYLAKKYLSPYIKKSLKHREEQIFLLEQEVLGLRVKKTDSIREMDEQKAYAAQLLWKVQLWKNVMEERCILQDQERTIIEKKSLEYLKKRADGLCHEYLKREVIPQIFAQTKEQVLTFFVDEKIQKKYIATSLISMTKGNLHG